MKKNFKNCELPHYDDSDAKILCRNRISYVPKVSVIIPVYNVEQYLRRCLESVVKQTLKEIEIICVDDGSTDSSLSILKEFARNDNRITLVAPNHIGTGRCRNIALGLVKGEYIGFVDPDDWIEEEYYEKLYSFSSGGPDIVFQTARHEIYPDENREVVIDTPKSNNDYVFRFNVINYSGHLWSKIFKRSFIEEHNLRNSFTKRAQDLLLTFPAILLANEIRCINHAKYFYRKGHKSACTVEYTPKDADELFSLYSQIEKKVSEFNENMLSLVKYKKNLTLKKTFETSSESVKGVVRKRTKNLYEVDFNTSKKVRNIITIKNPAPNNIDMLWWGDYWLGLDLAQGLKKQGRSVKSEYFDTKRAYSSTDINIVIRGINRNQFIDNSKLNILYLISHPDDVSLSEVIQYDIVIVASKKKCQYFKKHGVRAYYLPQFTNPERFFYEQDSAFRTKILFVGNAYGGMRPAVDYATKNKLPISVFGKFWDKYLIDKKYIKGEYVDNNDLHKYYSNADIVLNDTNENMKLEGFVSNRIHDATACKSFVVSDYLPEIEKIYGDSIPMYRTEAEFCEIIKYYLSHPSERKAKAEKAYKITLKHYTNNVFAKKLDNIVSDYLLFKKPFSIFADYVLLPYNLLKLNRLKNLISPQLLDKLSQPVNVVDEEKIKKQKELVIDKILRLLMPVRIDLKNQGNSDNDLLVETDGKVSKPAYLTKNDGIGYVVEYTKLSNVIKLRIVHDGVLLIKFKSQDKRYKGNTYQFWIDYDSIKINDKEILSASVSSWHDKPYVYKLPVTNNQEIVIRVSIKYHNYSRDQILDILDKFSRESLKSLDLSDFIKLCEICGLNKS